jgi:aspartate kinase
MIVMKFGGTSVEDAKAITRVAAIVRGRAAQRPVVVVSAMARVTDQLHTMANAAASGDLDSALNLAKAMRERHQQTARKLLGKSDGELAAALNESCNVLEELLRGIAALRELSPRTTDHVLSFGELLSSRVVAAAFRARGLDGVLVDAREVLVTDGQHTHAVPQFDETNQKMAGRLQPLLQAGSVPVMGGFIGATREGTTTTIGRGGSDFSAAIVGAALGAKRIEIWTDVDGIKTTDPRLCPDARRLAEISFDEAAEMAYFGAKVLHPATMIPAMEENIPVYVLNSRNPRNQGTCVRARAPRAATRFTAIAVKKNITIVNVAAARMLEAHAFLHDVFAVFKRHQLPVELVSTSEVSVSLTVDSKLDIAGLLDELRQFAEAEAEPGKAIIAVIGENLRGTPGMLTRVFGAIADVNVRMVSQGASEINIGFVIEERDVPLAVTRLHRLLFSRRNRTPRPKNADAFSRASAAIAPLVGGAEPEREMAVARNGKE